MWGTRTHAYCRHVIRSGNSLLSQMRNGPECPLWYVENLSSPYGSPLSSAAAKRKLPPSVREWCILGREGFRLSGQCKVEDKNSSGF